MCDIAGMRYASRLLDVVDDGGRAALHRRREIIGPGERREARDVTVGLDRVTAEEVAEEAVRLGFVGEPHRFRARDRGVPRIDGGNRSARREAAQVGPPRERRLIRAKIPTNGRMMTTPMTAPMMPPKSNTSVSPMPSPTVKIT